MNKYLLIIDKYDEHRAYLTEAKDFYGALTKFYDYFGGSAVLTTNLFNKAIKNELSETAIKLFEKEHDKVVFFGVVNSPFKCEIDVVERENDRTEH